MKFAIPLLVFLFTYSCEGQFNFGLPSPPRINFGRFQPIINAIFSRPTRFRPFRRAPPFPPRVPQRRPPPPPPQFRPITRPVQQFEPISHNFLVAPERPVVALSPFVPPPPPPPHVVFGEGSFKHIDQGFGHLRPESLMTGHTPGTHSTNELVFNDVSNHIELEEPSVQQAVPQPFFQPQSNQPPKVILPPAPQFNAQAPLHQETVIHKLEPITQVSSFQQIPPQFLHTSGRFQDTQGRRPHQASNQIHFQGFHRLPPPEEPLPPHHSRFPINNPDNLKPNTILSFSDSNSKPKDIESNKNPKSFFQNENILGMNPPPVLSTTQRPPTAPNHFIFPATPEPQRAQLPVQVSLLTTAPELNSVFNNDIESLVVNPVPRLNAGILPLANEQPQEDLRFPPFN